MQSLIHRLISGNFLVPVGKTLYTVRPPTVAIKQMADAYHDQLIHEYRFSELPRKDMLIRRCIASGILDKDYQKNLDKLTEDIDNTKLQMFRAGPRITTVKDLRKSLDKLRSTRSKITSYVANIERNSLDGFADTARDRFMLIQSIYVDDQPATNLPYPLLNAIVYQYHGMMSTVTELRAIVRSPSWRQMWGVAKHNLFIPTMGNLSEEQQTAIHFSELYDFAYNSQDRPSEKVFQDDDVFDGWYLDAIEKFKNKQNEPEDNGTGDRFIVARDQEEANAIYASNTAIAKKALADRAIALNNKGSLRALEFPDVQQELTLRSNQMFIQKMKGK